MATEDQPVEFNIDELDKELSDGKGAPAPTAKTEIEAPKKTDLDSGIDNLRHSLEQERSARADAERRAIEATNRAAAAQNETVETQKNLVATALETAKQNSMVLRSNYAIAMQAGDYEGAAKVQEEIAINAARLIQLEEGRQALEAAPKASSQSQAPNHDQIADPVEHLARQLTPRSAAWIRSNPDYARDPRLYQRMLAAHNLVVTDGVEAESDEYFRRVEGTLGIRREGPESQAAPQRRETAPPAAPVSRQASTSGSSRPSSTVTLSREEREMAANMGMTEKEYALSKLQLQREGKL